MPCVSAQCQSIHSGFPYSVGRRPAKMEHNFFQSESGDLAPVFVLPFRHTPDAFVWLAKEYGSMRNAYQMSSPAVPKVLREVLK